MKYFRLIVIFLALLQMLLSFLFYKFGSLFFFLDERSEVVPVNSLVSQGGGENLLISIGFFLFFILSVFNVVRIKYKVGVFDLCVLFIALAIQSVSLLMIEVASFSISVDQVNGWILAVWFVVYASLWLVLIAFLINKISRGRLLPGGLNTVS